MPSNSVDIDNHLITDYLNNRKWQELIQYLKERFRITRNDLTGQPHAIVVKESTIECLSYILQNLIEIQSPTVDVFDVTTEIFRSLRNSTAFNPGVQTMIVKDTYILQTTLNILHQFLKSNSRDEDVKMIIQFLINVVAQNPDTSIIVWDKFEKIIVKLFRERKYSYHISALFYNIVYLNRSFIKDCNGIFTYLLDGLASCDQNIYYTFLLEILLQDINFMNIYQTFEIPHKITLLLAVADLVSNNNEDFKITLENVQQLALRFKIKSDCILKTETSFVDNIEPQEVVLLLEILASLSSQEKYSETIQNDKCLIINCAFLLKNIHTLGKESQNLFTPIQKLSEVASTNNETRKNPVFGFKADLIRLLGNVCWNNKENQDKLRELECIPLLLDCCNIDARNPFIIQWTILAVRNVCHNNPTNQNLIAGMTKRGVVNTSTLQEMGLTLHDDGTNKIVIGPLPEK